MTHFVPSHVSKCWILLYSNCCVCDWTWTDWHMQLTWLTNKYVYNWRDWKRRCEIAYQFNDTVRAQKVIASRPLQSSSVFVSLCKRQVYSKSLRPRCFTLNTVAAAPYGNSERDRTKQTGIAGKLYKNFQRKIRQCRKNISIFLVI